MQINKNLAAIDIGTNSFHLIVVRMKDDGDFEVIKELSKTAVDIVNSVRSE